MIIHFLTDPLPFNTLYDSEDSLVMLRGLILILCGISLVKANKYCDICPKHTMCVFKVSTCYFIVCKCKLIYHKTL